MRVVATAAVLLAFAAIAGVLAFQLFRDRDYRDLLDRGDRAMGRGDSFLAIEAYSGAIGLRPDSMVAHVRRGEAYELRGELEAAARDYRKATTLAPTAPRPLEALGDALSARGRYEAALEAYEARFQLDDASPEAAIKLALARYRLGDVDGSLEAVHHTLRLDDSLADAHYLLGLCLRDTGDPRGAIAAFEQAVTLAPTLLPAREELADLYQSSGRRGDQLAQLQLLADLERGSSTRVSAVAEAMAGSGQTDLAALTIGNAMERATDQPLLATTLGKIWLDVAVTHPDRIDALPKALIPLSRVASAEHAGSYPLSLYGRALLIDHQYEMALRVLKRAVGTYPLEATTFDWLALAAALQGQPAVAREAIADFRALATTDHAFSAHQMAVARLALQIDEPVQAATWFGRAVEREPDDPRLLAQFVDALLRAGEADTARAEASRGLEQHPGDTTLQALLERAGYLAVPLP